VIREEQNKHRQKACYLSTGGRTGEKEMLHYIKRYAGRGGPNLPRRRASGV